MLSFLCIVCVVMSTGLSTNPNSVWNLSLIHILARCGKVALSAFEFGLHLAGCCRLWEQASNQLLSSTDVYGSRLLNLEACGCRTPSSRSQTPGGTGTSGLTEAGTRSAETPTGTCCAAALPSGARQPPTRTLAGYTPWAASSRPQRVRPGLLCLTRFLHISRCAIA